MHRVFTLFGKWMLVIATISAIGGHFMVLQSVAWTSMVLSNVRHENIGTAIEQTFDGQHPCPLCKRIEKARESESKQQTPQQVAASKLNLFYQARIIILTPAGKCQELRPCDTFAQVRPHRPLLQPPREALA